MSDANGAPPSTKTAAEERAHLAYSICNQLLEAVNAREISTTFSPSVLDGMLMAYVNMANAVGLLEDASFVMIDEGIRLAKRLRSERLRADQTAAQSLDVQLTGKPGQAGLDDFDADAMMNGISAAARSRKPH